MEIKELRIGNYIRHNVKEDGTDQFIEPNEDSISEDDMWNLVGQGLDGAEPIPLTEEWLLKFEFTRQNNAWNSPHKDNDFSLWNPKGESEFTLNDTIHVIRIDFVHQLQNLYFSLTGLELEIKK